MGLRADMTDYLDVPLRDRREAALDLADTAIRDALGLAIGLRHAYAKELAGCGVATLVQMIGDLGRARSDIAELRRQP